ncbi:MAG: nucleotidyltransferase domain-containing protein [Deltaproteobacteria bacterium]|nr:nucleotidyltransferase domain-containing protein [Deltaproteobacteria bacterium]
MSKTKMRPPNYSVLQVKTFSLSNKEKGRIIEFLKNELSKDKRVVSAFLYGSFLDEDLFRDIDVGVFIRDTNSLPPLYEFQLGDKLSRALKDAFPVEVRIINEAPVTFLYHVIKGKLLLCRDEDFCSEFVAIVARKYNDIQPILNHYTKEAYGRSD